MATKLRLARKKILQNFDPKKIDEIVYEMIVIMMKNTIMIIEIVGGQQDLEADRDPIMMIVNMIVAGKNMILVGTIVIVEEKIAIKMRIVRDYQDDQIQETGRQKNWVDHEIDHQSELDQNQFEIVPDHLIESRSRKLSRKSREVENDLILAMKMSTEN